MNSPDVAVIILCWNGRTFLETFLPSVVEHTPASLARIIIADNGSTDDSEEIVKKYSGVEWLPLNHNYGFSEGYNQAIAKTGSKWIVLLNQDVEVSCGWLNALLSFAEQHPNLAACQPKILALNRRTHFEYAGAAGGFLDKYGYPFCRGRIFDSIEEDNGQYNNAIEIAWASGACLFVKKDAYLNAGGLDSEFFAHMEEIDLCWRIKNSGMEVWYVPTSTVYHLGGGSLPQGNPKKVYLNFRNSLMMLYKNLPSNKRGRIIFLRILIDHIAAYHALFGGNTKEFKAIAKAHFHFLFKSGSWKKKQNQKNKTDYLKLSGFYNGSIVWKYFIQKKKIFGELYWNK
ncbi:glycosyl transferase [Bacteroidota bacterium]|nr:glycosyl transferase [Bacteroidota bacterium]